jgi:hypothetical protein
MAACVPPLLLAAALSVMAPLPVPLAWANGSHAAPPEAVQAHPDWVATCIVTVPPV